MTGATHRWNIGDDGYGHGERPRRAVDGRGRRPRRRWRESRSCPITDAEGAHRVSRLLSEIWATDDDQPIVAAEIIRTLAHVNGYGVDGGVRLGESSAPPSASSARDDVGTYLHSYIAGVKERAARQQRRLRPQAAPAGLGTAAADWQSHLDVRPTGPPQRLLQPRQARRHGRRLPPRLLRHDARRRERRRLERPHPHRVEPRVAARRRRQRALRPHAGRPRGARRAGAGCATVRRSRWRARGRHRERGAVELVQIPDDIVAVRAADPGPRPPVAVGAARDARRRHSRRAITPTASPATAGTSCAETPARLARLRCRTEERDAAESPAPSARYSPTWARRSCRWCPHLAGSTSRSASRPCSTSSTPAACNRATSCSASVSPPGPAKRSASSRRPARAAPPPSSSSSVTSPGRN